MRRVRDFLHRGEDRFRSALEEGAFRSTLIKAVVAGTNRSKELGK